MDIGNDGVSNRGWHHTAGASNKKWVIEGFPKTAKSIAYARLGQVESEGCPGDAAFSIKCIENNKKIQVYLVEAHVIVSICKYLEISGY